MQQKLKVYGSNTIAENGDYARVSIPPQVMDDRDGFEPGAEVEFKAFIDEDQNTLVLELVDE